MFAQIKCTALRVGIPAPAHADSSSRG